MKRTVLKKISRKAGIKRKLSKPGRIIKAKRSRALTKIVSKASGKRKGISKRSEVIKVTKVEKRKPLAKFNPTPRAISEIKIGLASSAAFNSVPQITITKIWSNTFSGVVANYLPPKEGSGGAHYNFIMVGTDNNNVARIGATVKADDVPSGSTVQVRIAYKDPSTGNIVPIGSMDSYSGETALLSANNTGTDTNYDFFVVAWIDDGSGYNSSDVQDDTSNRWTIYFVDLQTYQDTVSALADLLVGSWIIYPYASAFLTAFLQDQPIQGGIRSSAPDLVSSGTIRDNEPLLHHNTGVVWQNGSPPYGNIRRNVFNKDNDFANIIRNSQDFQTWVKKILTNNKTTVQNAKLHSWPPDGKFQFNVPQDTISFTNSEDLHLAIGTGHFKNCVLIATVRESDLELTNLDFRGELFDYYDFDVKAGFPNDWGAWVQAGYNPSGGLTSGHVFETIVFLDKTNLGIQFNFS